MKRVLKIKGWKRSELCGVSALVCGLCFTFTIIIDVALVGTSIYTLPYLSLSLLGFSLLMAFKAWAFYLEEERSKS